VTAVPPDGRALVGRTVRLDAAQPADAAGLFAALDHDAVWASGYGGGAGRPRAAGSWRDAMAVAAADGRVMYIVRRVEPGNADDGRIVGTTSLGDVEVRDEKLHLGWTAYSPDVWSTSVNPECKLLLFTHAFEDRGFGRVKLRTDLINTRSQAAIAKLGATREGVARRHIKRADGSWRDSVIFSVIIDDWPVVKAGLQSRLLDPRAK
jgi:RimJ/RimL family protein N-acetyltransferase